MSAAATTMTVDALMKERFESTFTQRSSAFRDGVRVILDRRINGSPYSCPHRPGTAEADAFWSGNDEGHRLCNERGIPQARGGK